SPNNCPTSHHGNGQCVSFCQSHFEPYVAVESPTRRTYLTISLSPHLPLPLPLLVCSPPPSQAWYCSSTSTPKTDMPSGVHCPSFAIPYHRDTRLYRPLVASSLS